MDPLIPSSDPPPKLIVLDFDDTEDPAHGQQEQRRDDGDAGSDGFLPRHVYEGLSGRLITTIFKAKRFSHTQMLSWWKRRVQPLCPAWPHPLIVFRGDSPLADPEGRQGIEAPATLHEVTGWTSHGVLTKLAYEVVEPAKWADERDGTQVTRFHSTRYQAATESGSRHGVIG